MGTEAEVRMVTAPMVRYLRNLRDQRDTSELTSAQLATLEDDVIDRLTFQQASKAIDTLKAFPKLERAPQAPLEAGMYKIGETIFKVQSAVHGSGNLYAKELVVEHDDDDDDVIYISFVYAPGAIRNLTPEHRMSLEEAKAFGALYGTCCVCGRTLTNEVSIDAGIGPVCSGRI